MFLMFYGFHLCIIGITSPGRLYSSFLDQHFNYIKTWRQFSISATASILKMMGYTVFTTETTLKVHGHAGFKLVYSCLGYGIMSCFASFVLSFPKPWLSRFIFLVLGLATIQILNIIRFTLISIYYKPQVTILQANHHDLFNYTLYTILLLIVYLWLQFPQTKKRNQQQFY
nr:archaeosortase/exosortase family protein [Pedobacter schmidteae]